jgi:hypothetical protein
MTYLAVSVLQICTRDTRAGNKEVRQGGERFRDFKSEEIRNNP